MFYHQITLLEVSLNLFNVCWLKVRYESFPDRGLRVGFGLRRAVAHIDHGL